MKRLRTATLLLAVIAGCGEASPEASASMLEVGTGSWRFEAVEDGEVIDLVRGAQGGWHLWVSFRITGPVEGIETIELTRQMASEEGEPTTTVVPANFDPMDSQGRRAVVGWIEIVAEPSCKVGELMRFSARAEGLKEGALTDEVMIEVGAGSFPPPACE